MYKHLYKSRKYNMTKTPLKESKPSNHPSNNQLLTKIESAAGDPDKLTEIYAMLSNRLNTDELSKKVTGAFFESLITDINDNEEKYKLFNGLEETQVNGKIDNIIDTDYKEDTGIYEIYKKIKELWITIIQNHDLQGEPLVDTDGNTLSHLMSKAFSSIVMGVIKDAVTPSAEKLLLLKNNEGDSVLKHLITKEHTRYSKKIITSTIQRFSNSNKHPEIDKELVKNSTIVNRAAILVFKCKIRCRRSHTPLKDGDIWHDILNRLLNPLENNLADLKKETTRDKEHYVKYYKDDFLDLLSYTTKEMEEWKQNFSRENDKLALYKSISTALEKSSYNNTVLHQAAELINHSMYPVLLLTYLHNCCKTTEEDNHIQLFNKENISRLNQKIFDCRYDDYFNRKDNPYDYLEWRYNKYLKHGWNQDKEELLYKLPFYQIIFGCLFQHINPDLIDKKTKIKHVKVEYFYDVGERCEYTSIEQMDTCDIILETVYYTGAKEILCSEDFIPEESRIKLNLRFKGINDYIEKLIKRDGYRIIEKHDCIRSKFISDANQQYKIACVNWFLKKDKELMSAPEKQDSFLKFLDEVYCSLPQEIQQQQTPMFAYFFSDKNKKSKDALDTVFSYVSQVFPEIFNDNNKVENSAFLNACYKRKGHEIDEALGRHISNNTGVEMQTMKEAMQIDPTLSPKT
jgi:hypothetical protein